MRMTDFFRNQLDRAPPISRRALERVPEGRPDWKPHEKSMPLGYLATLVAFMPVWIAMTVNRDELDIRPASGQSIRPKEWKTTADLLQLLDDSVTQARQALAGRADAVTASLASFDRLAAHQAQSNGGLVITHGEPHGGNLMHTGGRLVLIDWDTVALAPPERDLWMLDDGTDGALAAYTEATGRIVDPMAISYYRLAWMLADLASFTGLLRAEHQRDADTEHAWRALRSYLYPDSTELTGPYRHVLEPQRQPG